MGLWQRLGLGGGRRKRPAKRSGAGGFANVLDREGTPADLDDLAEFVRSRRGVEFYVEPETTATDTTAVAIAHDGEWIRRRVGTPHHAAKLARKLSVPIYDAQVVGIPERMRVWSRAHPERRLR